MCPRLSLPVLNPRSVSVTFQSLRPPLDRGRALGSESAGAFLEESQAAANNCAILSGSQVDRTYETLSGAHG